jgi:hypothetical protein
LNAQLQGFGVAQEASTPAHISILGSCLPELERKDLDTGIEEFDLKCDVVDCFLLPDELIHPRLSNLSRAIGAGIGSMTAARHGAIERYFEANGCPGPKTMCKSREWNRNTTLPGAA